MCRNHRCFKTCDRSRDCGSSNLRCVRDLCRLKDGCGGESINCFESGGDYGDGGFDDDEYRDEGNDEYDPIFSPLLHVSYSLKNNYFENASAQFTTNFFCQGCSN